MNEITSPIVKFSIGVTAGISAVALPKLSAALNSGTESMSYYFPTNVLVLICAFSLLLGFLTVILEHGIPKIPKDTFFAALAIPGLVAGIVSTTIDDSKTIELKQREATLLKQIEDIKGKLPTEVEFIKRISSNGFINNRGYSFEIIKSAHAAGDTIKPEYKGWTTAREIPKYGVVIKNTKTKQEALDYLKSIKEKVPNAMAVQTNFGFQVLSDEKLLDKYESFKRSEELDKLLNEKTSIIKYK